MNIPSTVTVKEAVIWFEEASATEYVTTVLPMEKADPEDALDVSVAEPELSLAVGSSHDTTAVAKPVPVLTVVSDGIADMVGTSLSVKSHQMDIQIYSQLYIY